jgi:catechol 2,3-dioxygenase-like lactoylglutathione lyase family enzyme
LFDHVGVWASDREASERFYDTVLATLDVVKTHTGDWYSEWDDFAIGQAGAEHPVTKRLHVGLVAPSRAHVDAFWQAGVDAGYREDGSPGPRPQYLPDYYGAFLLDPDGNSIEAVHHGDLRRGGNIDHLWIRVADVQASKRFYETAGCTLDTDLPERATFVGESGSFSLVPGDPTEHLHMAFPAAENATVDAFHRALMAAGYRDNGAPGERPIYHPGYYAAFVLDPDGNNIEVVNHNRP